MNRKEILELEHLQGGKKRMDLRRRRNNAVVNKGRKLKYLSLFSGIGGFELGIRKVFPNTECVGFSEIDPHAIKVYKHHFPNHRELGDVRKVNAKPFRGRIDFIVGGFFL